MLAQGLELGVRVGLRPGTKTEHELAIIDVPDGRRDGVFDGREEFLQRDGAEALRGEEAQHGGVVVHVACAGDHADVERAGDCVGVGSLGILVPCEGVLEGAGCGVVGLAGVADYVDAGGEGEEEGEGCVRAEGAVEIDGSGDFGA